MTNINGVLCLTIWCWNRIFNFDLSNINLYAILQALKVTTLYLVWGLKWPVLAKWMFFFTRCLILSKAVDLWVSYYVFRSCCPEYGVLCCFRVRPFKSICDEMRWDERDYSSICLSQSHHVTLTAPQVTIISELWLTASPLGSSNVLAHTHTTTQTQGTITSLLYFTAFNQTELKRAA